MRFWAHVAAGIPFYIAADLMLGLTLFDWQAWVLPLLVGTHITAQTFIRDRFESSR